jgi:aerobic carbon-monoxide dehydrogenase medium subunit
MIPAAFEYQRPGTLDEALALLAKGDGARVLAGGQSLLPLMKLRLASAGTVVDIGRLGELKGIRRLSDGRLAVGALTTYAELLDSPAMNYGLLADALPLIGDVQVRNRGTVGGAVAHADPASDLPACLIALDAELVARSLEGERTIPMETFCESAFVTGLREGEILTEIRLPAPRDDAGSAYRTLEQPASGYAMVGVAAVVMVGADGRITDARLGVTGVADRPYRATAADRALVGTDGSGNAVAAAAARVAEGHVVSSDIHADREYRAAMAVVYARRAIEGALARLAG